MNGYTGEVLISLPESYENINEDDINIEVFSAKSFKELFTPNYRSTTLLISLVEVNRSCCFVTYPGQLYSPSCRFC